jgi:hypothetical protein
MSTVSRQSVPLRTSITCFILVASLAAGSATQAQSAPGSCSTSDPRAARIAESLRNAEANVERLDKFIAIQREGIEMQNGFEREDLRTANYAKLFAGAKSVKAVTDSVLTAVPAGRGLKKLTEVIDPAIEGGYALYDGQYGNAAEKAAQTVSKGTKRLGYSKQVQGAVQLGEEALTGANAALKGDLAGWCAAQLGAAGGVMDRSRTQEKLLLKGLSKTCKGVMPSPTATVGAHVADGMDASAELLKAAQFAQKNRGAAQLSKHVGQTAGVLGRGAEFVKNEEKFFEGLNNMLEMDDMKLDISMLATGQRTQMLSRIKVKTAERDRWAGEAARLRAELNRLGGCSEQEAKTVIAGGGRGPNSMNPTNLFDPSAMFGAGYDEQQLLAMIDHALTEGSRLLSDPSTEPALRNILNDSLNYLRTARQEILSGSFGQNMQRRVAPPASLRNPASGPSLVAAPPGGSSRRSRCPGPGACAAPAY